MATQDQTIGEAWTDIKSTLSMSDAQKYTVQNTGAFPLRIREDASLPAIDARGHVMESNDLLSITPTAAVNVYVKKIPNANGNGIITITEAT